MKDIRPEVLASPAYQDRCAILLDLFRASREAGRDPHKLLVLQSALGELLGNFQGMKSQFKRESNELGAAVAGCLVLTLKRIADSVVWRVLGYDRVVVQLLAEHAETGHLDDTVFNDLALAQKLVDEQDAIVLINDLTSILRHGDLTIITRDGIAVMETKHGKATRRNVRAIRQRRNLEGLVSFLNTGVRTSASRRDFIVKVDVPIHTYQQALAGALAQARQDGYHQLIVSDHLAIEALWMADESAEFPKLRPFDGEEHILRTNNLQLFHRPATRIAPYGIFQLDDETCFDLTTGNLLLETTLNFDSLQSLYRQRGMFLEIPEPSQEEIETYLSAPIAQRKKIDSSFRIVVSNGIESVVKTPDLFARIHFEFMHEDSFIEADRQLLDLLVNLPIPDNKTTRLYVGYKNEDGIWS